jgi:hypothetical protein
MDTAAAIPFPAPRSMRPRVPPALRDGLPPLPYLALLIAAIALAPLILLGSMVLDLREGAEAEPSRQSAIVPA